MHKNHIAFVSRTNVLGRRMQKASPNVPFIVGADCVEPSSEDDHAGHGLAMHGAGFGFPSMDYRWGGAIAMG